MSYTNIESLVSNYGYTLTQKFNGLTTMKNRQLMAVVTAALVPADWNGSKQIVAKAILEARNGKRYDAYVYANGTVRAV